MEAFFQQLLDWVSANPAWAYFILFAVALAESLAVVGVIVPGVVVIVAAGALIGAGALSFWVAWLVAAVGAIVGDGLSYGLGCQLKGRARDIWPFARHPSTLERGERFFARFGIKSIAFGRFVGPVRAVIPMIAGMFGMTPGRFFLANVASAIVWAPAYLFPGIVFGASLKLAAEAATRLVLLALALALALWFTAWATRRLFLLLSPRAGAWLSDILRWADLHPSMGKVALALADPDHPDAGILTSLAGLLILATFLLVGVTSVLVIGPPEFGPNQTAVDLALSLHTPAANGLMAGLGRLGDPLVLATVVAIIYLYLRRRRNRRHANYWLAAAGFAVVATTALGALLQVPRPEVGAAHLTPWSFPSFEVLAATTAYGFLAVALARGVPAAWRWAPYVVATLIVTAVSAARLYFATAWLTDILGSLALGLIWVATLGLAFRRHSRFDLRWPGLSAIALTTLAAAVTVRSLTGHAEDLARLVPPPQPTVITEAAWRNGVWQELPQRRTDLWQRRPQPLSLQYAGEPNALAEAMAKHGWHRAQRLDWRNAVRLLSPTLSLTQLPVIPRVQDGQHEALVLVKPGPDQTSRSLLRLWPTPYRIDGRVPLWVGNVTTQHKGVLLGLIALPITDSDGTDAGRRLQAALGALAPEPLPEARPILLRLPP